MTADLPDSPAAPMPDATPAPADTTAAHPTAAVEGAAAAVAAAAEAGDALGEATPPSSGTAAQEAGVESSTARAEPVPDTTADAPSHDPAADKTPGLSPAACGARLAELFPALFGTDGPPKPIKLRIHVDLQARAPGVFSRRALGPFFARYTTTNAYLKVLSTASERFDLDGQPAGEVTEEHRSAALAELARRREIAIAKRAAERGGQRAPARPRGDGGPGGASGGASGGAPAGVPEGATSAPRRPPRGPRRDDRRPDVPRDGAPGPAREGRRTDRADGAERTDRAVRPTQPPRDGRPAPGAGPGPRRHDARPPRSEHTGRGDRPDRRVDPRANHRPERPAEAPEPQDPAQRERALLLRQFESSPLTKANFCVLRRIAESELDTQLDLARRERAERHKR